MKPNIKFAIIILSTMVSFGNSYSQNSTNYQQEACLLVSAFKKNHYSPSIVNNDFSEKVFDRFIEALDPKGLVFTQEDLEILSPFKHSIDDELCGNSWQFLSKASNLYKERLLATEKIYTSILSKPFNFKITETISFQDKGTSYTANTADLNIRWNKWLKYRMLNLLSHSEDSTTSITQLIEKKESFIREKLKVIESRNTNNILNCPNGFEAYVANEFLAAIAFEFDPHSQYLSKTRWQNFESSMSKDSYSFGFYVEENDKGELIIEKIAPGGPAWKSNEVHKGDILLSIQWEGGKIIDLLGADLSEFYNILEASNNTKLHITIKKTNEQIKKVSLLKEKIKEEENIVKSFVLNGNKKVGYISLPAFYTEWENLASMTNGCANDVAKEIIKLQKENIEGLILDIRYNGGGSLVEGLNLAGIFINEGPLFMIKARDEKPIVMKDMNRGTVYDGPLVVMVNGQSASASELLASTLQDYNRALIVGSNTYGKATGQTILPLDTTLNINSGEKAILKSQTGLASITVIKLFRITGKTAQLCGVQPDIELPDLYDLFDYKESTYKNALSSDSINKKVIYTPLNKYPLKLLSDKSQSRVMEKKEFNKIRDLTKNKTLFKSYYSNIPLTPKEYKTHVTKSKELWKSVEKNEKSDSASYQVAATNYDQYLISLDEFSKEINESIIKNIKEDIYIEESFFILSDLIEHNKK